MGGGFSSGSTPKYERTMFFIDGGYLRQNIRDVYSDDNIDYGQLSFRLSQELNESGITAQLVRSYYYDAIPQDQQDSLYQKQLVYTNEIKKVNYHELRLARLKRRNKEDSEEDDRKKYKQKGADVLLAIDMLQKAYENQYEWAMLLTGDEDLLDLVNAVKNLGKRVYGFYFEKHISQELIDSYDKRCVITKSLSDVFHRKEKIM